MHSPSGNPSAHDCFHLVQAPADIPFHGNPHPFLYQNKPMMYWHTAFHHNIAIHHSHCHKPHMLCIHFASRCLFLCHEGNPDDYIVQSMSVSQNRNNTRNHLSGHSSPSVLWQMQKLYAKSDRTNPSPSLNQSCQFLLILQKKYHRNFRLQVYNYFPLLHVPLTFPLPQHSLPYKMH